MSAGRSVGGGGAERAQPHDVETMQQLLRSMGVDEYEPRVVNQLMDYMYKYITDVLLDAEVYSEHAGRPPGHVDLGGVQLAIQSQTASYVQPPSQDQVAEIAKLYNDVPLPDVVVKPGLPLPPDAKQLTAPNWQYDPSHQYQQR